MLLLFSLGKRIKCILHVRNALNRRGELGRYSTRLNQKLTHQCEQASGILHPCCKGTLYLDIMSLILSRHSLQMSPIQKSKISVEVKVLEIISFSKKNLSGILSKCQTAWIHVVGPDLGPNCLQKLSTDDISRQS